MALSAVLERWEVSADQEHAVHRASQVKQDPLGHLDQMAKWEKLDLWESQDQTAVSDLKDELDSAVPWAVPASKARQV